MAAGEHLALNAETIGLLCQVGEARDAVHNLVAQRAHTGGNCIGLSHRPS